MKSKPLILCIALCAFTGCKPQDPPISEVPVVLDTTHTDMKYRMERWLATAEYEPLYLGPPQDTIVLDYRLAYTQGSPAAGCFIDWLDEREFEDWQVDPLLADCLSD
jgi:hypothetical protein